MAFCGQCGREVPQEDAFCSSCGAPVAGPQPPQAAAPEPQAAVAAPPPPSTSPPAVGPVPAPEPPTPARRRRPVVWIAILIGVLVLGIAGAAWGLIALFPREQSTPVSSADPGSLGFDAEPFDPAAMPVAGSTDTGFEEPTATTEPTATYPEPPAQSLESSTPETPPDLSALVPPKKKLTKAEAIDAVGRMLDYMRRGKQGEAVALVTKNMLADVNNDKTWFSPGSDVFLSFEVQGTTKKGSKMKVRVLEQWNSGPERTTYDVVIKNGKHKVDGIKWSSW